MAGEEICAAIAKGLDLQGEKGLVENLIQLKRGIFDYGTGPNESSCSFEGELRRCCHVAK